MAFNRINFTMSGVSRVHFTKQGECYDAVSGMTDQLVSFKGCERLGILTPKQPWSSPSVNPALSRAFPRGGPRTEHVVESLKNMGLLHFILGWQRP